MMTERIRGWIFAIALGGAFACTLALAPNADATVLVDEPFTHADGNLVGQTPLTGGTWAAHSGEGVGPIQVTSGAAVVDQPNGSEDANTTFTAMGAGDKYYAGFDVKVTGGDATVYFAHFKTSGTYYASRVFVTAFTGADYTFGFSNTSALDTGSATWATGLTFGIKYRVVVSYDYDTGVSELWVNATAEGDTHITATNGYAEDAIEGFALRQATGDSVQTIDNLLVGETFAEVAGDIDTGACCTPTGVCSVTTEINCVAPNEYQGDGTGCDPNPCKGACCTPAGGCTETTEDDCTTPDEYQGDGTTCDPNPCVGACCTPTGECNLTTEDDCTGDDEYQGGGTNCEPNLCPGDYSSVTINEIRTDQTGTDYDEYFELAG
ncbi:MAG: hypothetical protein JXQ75_04235, partial [Phycisphaerae bacterium]|nr:hypothetical protein [Phycisphaerae bacterium]